MMRLRLSSAVFSFAALAGLAVACGSRGPLDLGDGPQIGGNPAIAGDASAAEDVGANDDGASVGAPDAGTPKEAGNTFDSGIPIVNCGACVFQSCGQDVIACVTNQGCLATLQCVGSMCLTGGGTPSPQCLFTCGQNDPQSVPQIINLFMCVLNSCGQDCTGVLTGGGIPGLGGDAGGGGGGRRDGGGGPGRDAG
jgi:hypothetical protein